MLTPEQTLQQAWKVHQQGHPNCAETAYRSVLKQLPEHASAWCYLGIALHDQKRYQDAINAYRQALKCNPHFPIALNNLGNSLRYDYQSEEADRCFLEAIRLKPDYFNAHKNRGTLHVWTGNLELALESYTNALNLNPSDPELHRNLGVLYLLQANFERGWQEFRWRWNCPESPRPKYGQPVWQGEPLAGKTILLYAEQGLGDTFQYIRFAKRLRQTGARVLIHGPAALTALLQNSDCYDRWIPQTIPVEAAFDYHCSLVDVADRLVTHQDNIPSEPQYIRPAQYLIEYWRNYFATQLAPDPITTPIPSSITSSPRQPESLPKVFNRPHPIPPPLNLTHVADYGRPAKLRIGIVWQGNRDFQADIFRSAPLAIFEPLAELPCVQLFSLQQGYGVEQLDQWQGKSPIIRLPEQVDRTSGPFMDTAAILTQLDLVLSIDTSIAHLAGAIGCPTWLLLSYVPDWRWFLDRTDTPWYPAHRLFRQPTQGNWPAVIQQVIAALNTIDEIPLN